MDIVLYRLPQVIQFAEPIQAKTRRFQCAEEVLHHRPLRQAVGDNLPVKQIENWRQGQIFTLHRELRNTCDPFFVGLRCSEVPAQGIGRCLAHFPFWVGSPETAVFFMAS